MFDHLSYSIFRIESWTTDKVDGGGITQKNLGCGGGMVGGSNRFGRHGGKGVAD
jgi:hypothetical protein